VCSSDLLFAILWFFITLLPTSSVFPIADAMADRRVYLPGFGFCLAVIAVYWLVFSKNFVVNKRNTIILLIIIGTHLGLLSAVTISRNRLYADPVLLWGDVINQYPENYFAYNNLGDLYYKQKDYFNAIKMFKKAAEIEPANPTVCNNLGGIYAEQKQYDLAIREFQKALAIEPTNAKTHNNLGTLYSELKDVNKAIIEYRKAIELNPNYLRAHQNLALVYYRTKQYDKVVKELENILLITPDDEYVKFQIKSLKNLTR
jgi:tetratricopeptide (TPR) repeat protein